MKTILVPTDFSACAEHALYAAAQLAQVSGAEIVLMHNIYLEDKKELLSPDVPHSPELIKVHKEAQKRIAEMFYDTNFTNVKITRTITFGIPVEEITNKANKINADLIIMGSHGNEGMDKVFIGSTVQKVIREASCPVMMIKKEFDLKKFNKIAIAFDPNMDIEKPFEKIKPLIKALSPTIFLVFINTPSDFIESNEANKILDHFITKHPGFRVEKVIYNHTDVAEGMRQFAEDNAIDLISLISHNRKGKPQYVIGNTETLAFRSTIPVMSVNIVREPLPMH